NRRGDPGARPHRRGVRCVRLDGERPPVSRRPLGGRDGAHPPGRRRQAVASGARHPIPGRAGDHRGADSSVSKMPLILVVEDNLAKQLLTTMVLSRDGFETAVAESAEDALVFMKSRRPDLILMDVQLPGMDGLTFASSLRFVPEAVGVPVVALTSHAMRGDRERAMAAGCVGYLSKPIDTRTLSDELRALIRQSGPASLSA